MNDVADLKKAYEDRDFLLGPDAWLLRVMSEYLEPKARFERYNIENGIVFFGSARIRSHEVTQARLREIEKQIEWQGGEPTDELWHEYLTATQDHKKSSYYEDAAILAEQLTHWTQQTHRPEQRYYVCSGGGPGIMDAALLGARRAGGENVALCIDLDGLEPPSSSATEKYTFQFDDFFMRKYWFMHLAQALVCFPGGFGTMEEFFEVLTLLQTNKNHRKDLSIVLYGSEFWNEVLNFDAFVKWGMIDAEDIHLFKICDTPDMAYEHLTSSLNQVHFMSL